MSLDRSSGCEMAFAARWAAVRNWSSKAALVASETIPDGLGLPTPRPAATTTPAMPTLSLDTTVSSTIEARSVSASEIPPPAQPATLSTIMLLLMVIRCHRSG